MPTLGPDGVFVLRKFLSEWTNVNTAKEAVKGTDSGNEACRARSTGQQKLVQSFGPDCAGLRYVTTATAPRRTRIQREKRELILEAALEVFSTHGFRGSTIDQIAEAAGMSKPNLLY